jgi:acyl-coenzyme A synthetase/AMP-(fatty) acid ligase
MIHLGLTNVVEIDGLKMKPIGVYANMCEEQLLADLASMYIGGTSIIALSEELIKKLDTVVKNPVAICTVKFANLIVELGKKGILKALKTVIFVDKPSISLLSDLNSLGITVKFWDEMINLGLSLDTPLPRSTGSTIAFLTGTSGTTGNPKVNSIQKSECDFSLYRQIISFVLLMPYLNLQA